MTDRPADRATERWLTHLWQTTPPTAPDEAAWAGVLARIEAAVPAAPLRPRAAPRRFPLRAVLALSGLAAAAVLLAVVLAGSRPRAPQPVLAIAPWAVADNAEVEIVSMDGADVPALVAGRPPQSGPLMLASLDDVRIDDTGHDVTVRASEDPRLGTVAPPMIIMPLEVILGKE